MSEQTVVIGGVEQIRSGSTNGHPWTIYKVTDGNGNDLGSCLDDVANAARPLVGKRAVIVNEVEENHKDGKTYKNLKLRSVEPEPERTNGDSEVDWDGKERRIVRQACLKAAAAVAAEQQNETITDAVVRVAAQFEQWVYRGFDDAAVPFPIPAGGFTDPGSEWRPPVTDEDIPF